MPNNVLIVDEANYDDISQPVLECDGMGTTLPNVNRTQFWKDYYEKGIKYVLGNYVKYSKSEKIKMFIFKHRITRYLYRKKKGRL